MDLVAGDQESSTAELARALQRLLLDKIGVEGRPERGRCHTDIDTPLHCYFNDTASSLS